MKNQARNALIALLALMFILSITRFAKAAGPSINLPGTVDATFINPGPVSYWKITLSSVPSGYDYDVTNGIYVGWCCDETFTINNGATLGVTLYSSYDPLQPWKGGALNQVNWNKVNYIINNKQLDTDNDVADDVQAAIWHYIDSNGGTQADTDVIAMENAADTYGGSFVPTSGQLLAVVVYLGGSQATFIEVTVPTYKITVTQTSNGLINPGTTVVNYGDTPSFSITPSTGYHIASITANGVPVTVTNPAGQSYQFSPVSADGTLTATYAINTYTLTTSVVGSGSVTRDNYGPYHYGDVVQLTAVPTVGWRFNHWSGDSSGSSNPTTVLINGNKAVTATFSVRAPSVGGEWAPITMQVLTPINVLQLLAPWIALALIGLASAVVAYRRFLKKRW